MNNTNFNINIVKSINIDNEIIGFEGFNNSAVLIPLMLVNGKYHVIFEKRSLSIPQGGEVCFPGGRIDYKIDASPEDAAIRECCEEIGVAKYNIKIIKKFYTVVSPIGSVVHSFIGEIKASSIKEFSVNESEVEYIFTVPLDFFIKNKPEEYSVLIKAHPTYIDESGKEVILLPAQDLNLPSRYNEPWGKGKMKVLIYKYNSEIIWGISAKLIYNFVLKMGDINEK